MDQLSFTIRYVHNGLVLERFLQYIPIYGHGAEYLCKIVLTFLSDNKIDLKNCRGQSYDNAANMTGQYSGLQARIKNENPKALFIPCSSHSLNLVGVNAVKSCPKVVFYFDFVQKLYTFFVLSLNILIECLITNKTLKRCVETRWSAHADAVNCLYISYDRIKDALKKVECDDNQTPEAKCEAKGLVKQMNSYEVVLLTVIWNEILSRFNATSKSTQNTNMNLESVVNLLT